jgi:membrane protease subunit (stomatin/prohibitin family)
VNDPARFLSEIVGTDGEFTMDEISYQIRNIIVQAFSRIIAGAGIPVLDMAANTHDLGKLVAGEITAVVAEYGLEIPEFYIENISLPPAVEQALDKRTSMGLAGDLARFTQYSTAETMTSAAKNPSGGGGIGAGLGMGMGMAMAQQMVEHVWHITENGQTFGPYSRARLGRMVTEGGLSRDTLVWTAGQDGWKRAEDVAELAQLFTIMPPPPPGA